MYREISLSGACFAELNTEIRFAVADARAGDEELLHLIPKRAPEDSSRISNCITRVLRAMMREGLVQFFVSESSLSSGSTEAEFLANKYSEALRHAAGCPSAFYIKI